MAGLFIDLDHEPLLRPAEVSLEPSGGDVEGDPAIHLRLGDAVLAADREQSEFEGASGLGIEVVLAGADDRSHHRNAIEPGVAFEGCA